MKKIQGLVVAAVVDGLMNAHDLNEYRLAPKRYHRKIRSQTASSFLSSEESLVQQPNPSFVDTPDFISLGQPIIPTTPNTSFLLDLPFPSHFLESLRMLNLSLPFIDTSIAVPGDPPTPEFDVNDVIKNGLYKQTSNQKYDISDIPYHGAIKHNEGKEKRRAINRVRHRIPARRLPKRSADLIDTRTPLPMLTTSKKPYKFRNWNASDLASIQRRQELYLKLRHTTTARPKLLKKIQTKLLNRRNQTNKNDTRKYSIPYPSTTELSIESTTENPSTAAEQGDLANHRLESSSIVHQKFNNNPNRFGFHAADVEPVKTLMGGFRPIQTSPPARPTSHEPISVSAFNERFINGPPDYFVPIVPSESSHAKTAATAAPPISTPTSTTAPVTTTPATTETFVDRFDFLPSGRVEPGVKPSHLSSKYISQFDTTLTSKDSVGEFGSKFFPSEEVTQIQKPEMSHSEFLIPTTSTVVPVTEFAPILSFPSFDSTSKEGTISSASTPANLPPPLSIEELVKKFTGKDLVIDIPSSNSTPTPTGNSVTPISSSVQPSIQTSAHGFSSIQTDLPAPQGESLVKVATAAANVTASVTDLEALDELEANLKKLLEITSSSSPVLNNSGPSFSFDGPPASIFPLQSTSTSGNFNQALPILPPLHSIPTTESTTFLQSQTKRPLETSTSGSEITKSFGDGSVFNSTSLSDPANSAGSVQRGPLDVSSFDNSFGTGQQSAFNFQSPDFQQQQQFQTNGFGGFPEGAFGGGSGSSGEAGQNPFFFGAGLFPGGQNQFRQNGFDGTVHLSPNGPPVGDFNAITQGLSLLASFGGAGGQFAIQHPPGFQQQSGFQPSFNDFNPASLQASTSIQSTANSPSQDFSSFSQAYPAFNLVQQHQTQSFSAPSQSFSAQPQSFFAHSPSPYHVAQTQNVPSNQQQQQIFSPVQQQSFQLIGGSNSVSGPYPVQVSQFQPQETSFQSTGTAPQSQSVTPTQTGINPSQFGTLLSDFKASLPSFEQAGLSAGTALITRVASNSGRGSSKNAREKSFDLVQSDLEEVRSKPPIHTIFAEEEEEPQSAQLIAIGPQIGRYGLASESFKAGSRKSLYNRGLRSGYYS